MAVKDSMSATTRHANATTTPEMRRFIQSSDLSVAKLARLLDVSEATVRKWRRRNSTAEASNKPHKLNTTLSSVQEFVVVELRIRLQLSLDKLLSITREFINPNVSRSGLARCLKRYGVSKLEEIDSSQERIVAKGFDQLIVRAADDKHISKHDITQQALAKALRLKGDKQEPVVRVVSKIIPQEADGEEGEPSYVFFACDADTEWVYVDIYQDGADAAAARYMSYVLRKAPFHLRRVLANNYAIFKKNFQVVDGRAARMPLNKQI